MTRCGAIWNLSVYNSRMVASLDVSNRVQSHAGVVRALLNARYYDGQRGQFTSQDPVFIQLGVPSQIQQLINRNQQQVLADPQLINAYSYGSDNPIRNSDPSGNGVLEGTISGGALIGGFFGVDIDTTNRGMQLILGPSVGPSIGGKLQGSWDPNATLDLGGAYYQTQANVSVLGGRSATRQAPINVFDPKQPLLGPQTDTSWAWSFGLNIGVTNAILLKSDPYYFANNNRVSTQVNWKALSGYSIGPLSNSVVNYASTAGANLKDPGFAAALRQINFASAPWLATSVSTPSTIKHQ
jgi:RHS repeat-associated protein